LTNLCQEGHLQGRTLQIACVYGDFTQCLAAKLTPQASLDVVDVLPVQLYNLSQKILKHHAINLLHGDSSELQIASDSYEQVLLFFLLHEQPENVRLKTLNEALRVLKLGGKLVIVDYHKPKVWHPLRWVMWPILYFLEPFALDLWQRDLSHWLPANATIQQKRTWTSGLYQLLIIEKR